MLRIYFAVVNDDLEIAKYLIEHGADVYILGSEQCSPLQYAITEDNIEMVKFLLQVVVLTVDKQMLRTSAFKQLIKTLI